LLKIIEILINRVGSVLVSRSCADALSGTYLSIATWRVLAALSNNGALRHIDLAAMTSFEVSGGAQVSSNVESKWPVAEEKAPPGDGASQEVK
jgi:hypothetical protein